MADELTVEFETDVGSVFEQIADAYHDTTPKLVLRAAMEAGGIISEQARENLSGTGTLAASFLPARFVSTTRDTVAAGALSDLPYAGVQNRGGEITPNLPRKNLPVPMTTQAKKLWPRDWGKDALELVFRRTSWGLKMFLANGNTFQYVLKKSVTINPSYYLDMAHERAKRELPETFGQEMRKALNKSMAGAVNG